VRFYKLERPDYKINRRLLAGGIIFEQKIFQNEKHIIRFASDGF
jgi:hypothetical protein